MPENRFEAVGDRSESHESIEEKNNAQLQLMEFMGADDTPGRAEWVGENSDDFRELWKDPGFRELMQEGNLEEAKLRLEELKGRRQKAA